MTGRGFEINQRGIEEMTRELQREFDKHPIRLPVVAGLPDLLDNAGGSVAIYNGPVILGNADGAQLAWNSQSVSQSQNEQPRQVDERYTELAEVTAAILRNLHALGLDDGDQGAAAEAGQEILTQATGSSPDASKIKRAVIMLRGCLAPTAIAALTGADQAVAEWARAAIEHLAKIVN
jgi:hypothetical protein